jgi:peptidoglycan/LPS O-acetylase OafA/YrhL
MIAEGDAVESSAKVAEQPSPTAVVNSSPVAQASVNTRFRPDIEGLRAIAVSLVLAFHAYSAPFTGGFVGVDVFFVISGFLITDLLLREQTKTGRVVILGFYARRVRRILPASTLVVILTVVTAYYFLGFVGGNEVATDAKWTAIFAANIHFGLNKILYFGEDVPPSPLQHMWSLGVEEQFYVVWPGMFLLLVAIVGVVRYKKALATTLLIIIAMSLASSVLETVVKPHWAFFSPTARAWELALGAFVAVLAPTIARCRPVWTTELLALCGLIGIASSAWFLNSSTPYPGSTVAWPVLSTAVVIAVGCSNAKTLVGHVLSLQPMQWLGARSYSLYLWHWPVLAIAATFAGHRLTELQNTVLLLFIVIASTLTYRLVEQPVRRSQFLRSRTGLTLAIGAALIMGTITVAQWLMANHYGTWNPFGGSGYQRLI